MMSDYNWCHNDKCHTYHTTDRIRGVKGNKVLRTRKIRVRDYGNHPYYQGWENHFCRVACFFNFVKKHVAEIVALAPVHEPSETPIEDPQKIRVQSNWGNHSWTETKIIPIENNQQ